MTKAKELMLLVQRHPTMALTSYEFSVFFEDGHTIATRHSLTDLSIINSNINIIEYTLNKLQQQLLEAIDIDQRDLIRSAIIQVITFYYTYAATTTQLSYGIVAVLTSSIIVTFSISI